MSRDELFSKLLKSFERYYNIKSEGVSFPFSAEAEFHQHDEQYLLVKAAKLSESDSHEYVFFASEELLSLEKLQQLDNSAWQNGLSRVNPYPGHRNSDISLIILADKIEDDAKKEISKIKRSKSYLFTFRGWSDYRVIALETSSNLVFHNRRGKDLKKLLVNL